MRFTRTSTQVKVLPVVILLQTVFVLVLVPERQFVYVETTATNGTLRRLFDCSSTSSTLECTSTHVLTQEQKNNRKYNNIMVDLTISFSPVVSDFGCFHFPVFRPKE